MKIKVTHLEKKFELDKINISWNSYLNHNRNVEGHAFMQFAYVKQANYMYMHIYI